MTVVSLKSVSGRGFTDQLDHPSLIPADAGLNPVQETFVKRVIRDGFGALQIEENGLQDTLFAVEAKVSPTGFSLVIESKGSE
jgi:hypothetical protein